MTIKKFRKFIAAAVVTFIFGAGSAHAGGFLADTFIKPFNPNLARQLDQANAAAGNPLDHAIAAGANAVVPGSGAVIEGAWAIQRSGMLSPQGFPPRVPNGQPMPPLGWPQPVGMPQPINLPPPGFPQPFPPGFPQQMPQMGNLCLTPMGVFPGPFNPVGMPCMTPAGQGYVVQSMR